MGVKRERMMNGRKERERMSESKEERKRGFGRKEGELGGVRGYVEVLQ